MKKFLISVIISLITLVGYSQTDQVGNAKLNGNLFYGSDTLNYRGVVFAHAIDSVPLTNDSSFAVLPVPHVFSGKELRAVTCGSMVAGDRNVTIYIRRIRSGVRTTMATISFTSDTDLTYTGGSIDTQYDDLLIGDLVYPVVVSGSGTNYRKNLSVTCLFK